MTITLYFRLRFTLADLCFQRIFIYSYVFRSAKQHKTVKNREAKGGYLYYQSCRNPGILQYVIFADSFAYIWWQFSIHLQINFIYFLTTVSCTKTVWLLMGNIFSYQHWNGLVLFLLFSPGGERRPHSQTQQTLQAKSINQNN